MWDLSEATLYINNQDGTFTDPTARNRPVLLFFDGSTISMKRAQEADLGFTFFEVYFKNDD